MSYEGYTQLLCANGHNEEIDCYSDPDDQCSCGAAWIWWNAVDTTNGSFDIDGTGKETPVRIDGFVSLVEKEPNQLCVCLGCNNVHIRKSATYQLPPPEVGHHDTYRPFHVHSL